MIELILFTITVLMVMVGLMMMPLNRSKNNAVVSMISYFILLIGLWVMVSSAINLCGLKINLITLSIINIVMGAASIAYTFIKGRRNEYYVAWQDVTVLLTLLVISVLIGMARFGSSIDVFAYGSDDSVRHFANAKALVNTGELTQGRNVMYIIDMIFIRCLDPIVGETGWYRAFLIADIFLLWVIGATFFAFIRRYLVTRYTYIVGIVLTLCYFLGYPVTNFLYGFEYLGAGILMITLLLWGLDRMEYQDAPSWFMVLILMISNTGVFLSYTQFAPAVLIGELVYVIVHYARKLRGVYGKPFWKILGEIFAVAVLGFATPACLCVSYVAARYWSKITPLLNIIAVIFIVFITIVVIELAVRAKGINGKIIELLNSDIEIFRKSKKTKCIVFSVGALVILYLLYKYVFQGMIVQFTEGDLGMVADGSIYREPYANFIIWLFPTVLYIMYCIQKKKNEPTVYMLITTTIFSAWLLSAIMSGSIGSYYFYKMHFIMWLFIFSCVAKEIVVAKKNVRKNLGVYGIIIFAAGIISISGIEKHFIEGNDWLWPDSVANRLYGVYNKNIEMLESGGNVNRDMQTMYNKIKEIVDRDDTFIPYFGEELRYLTEYYYYLTNQNPINHTADLNNHNYPSFNIREDLEKRGIKYIFVQKDYVSPSEQYDMEYAVMWMEYENEYGWIYKLD